MGAKVSKEMLKARRLIEQGFTAYEAAKQSGVTKQAIYVSKWWKERNNAKPT